ncbi:MAG: homoserine acetyltransferase, partial [Pseudomonadota bacterium]|nr:homoserine acetyltransferase [Pseudomonadota bacterium]
MTSTNLLSLYLAGNLRVLLGLLASFLLTLHVQVIASEVEQKGALIIEKQIFEMPHFTTFGGKRIKNVKVGWEAYGTLNDTKSNVILITHYFSGSSHAAGKYNENDPVSGYWDSIIGPGKAIDTER